MVKKWDQKWLPWTTLMNDPTICPFSTTLLIFMKSIWLLTTIFWRFWVILSGFDNIRFQKFLKICRDLATTIWGNVRGPAYSWSTPDHTRSGMVPWDCDLGVRVWPCQCDLPGLPARAFGLQVYLFKWLHSTVSTRISLVLFPWNNQRNFNYYDIQNLLFFNSRSGTGTFFPRCCHCQCYFGTQKRRWWAIK